MEGPIKKYLIVFNKQIYKLQIFNCTEWIVGSSLAQYLLNLINSLITLIQSRTTAYIYYV